MSQDGLLLVDKPEGITSHDVVARCRRFLNRRDIGHAGTLDPMATGLVVLLVGKATKLSDYILGGDKAYETRVLLGRETDTDDITGQVTAEMAEPPELSLAVVKAAVEKLSGTLELDIPIYSAKKVNGEKLYEKARRGEHFVPPKKKMEFFNVELKSFADARVEVSLSCSKGSFVRAWGRALGQELGCGGTLESLRRSLSAPYNVSQATPLASLEESDPESFSELSCWVPLNRTLPDWPALKIEGFDEKLILNGQISRKLERFIELEFDNPGIPGIKLISRRSSRLVSLLSMEPGRGFKIRRVFPQ